MAGKRCVHDLLLAFDMLIQTCTLEPFEILACSDAIWQLSDLLQPLDIAREQRMSRDTRQHLRVSAPPGGDRSAMSSSSDFSSTPTYQ